MGMKVAGNDLATIFHRNRRSEGLSSGGGTAVQHPHAGDGACGEDGQPGRWVLHIEQTLLKGIKLLQITRPGQKQTVVQP